MDGGDILLVFGTLAGVIIAGWMSYIMQKKITERQRTWALEDDKRNFEREIAGEQRRVKRGLLERRLDNVEEVLGLMMRVLISSIERGLGLVQTMTVIEEKSLISKVNNMYTQAYLDVTIIGSKELEKEFHIVSKKYWDYTETGKIADDDWNAVSDAHVAAVKIIDDTKTLGK